MAAALVLAGAGTAAQTVGGVATAGSACDSSGVAGISDQLVALQLCRMPGVFESLLPHANISPTSSRVHTVMVASSRDAVWAAAASVDLQINSVFRTLAEQYVLYHRSACYTPARPGTSPHESGRAIDLNNWSAAGVVAAMQSAGCAHSNPTGDPVHFDCPGGDLSADSVRTFQHLWNVNNPGDAIAEDGSYGPQTEARLMMSPAAGFANAGDCGRCTAHCEGAVLVSADCARGDCAAFGAACVDDAAGVRCVSGADAGVGDAGDAGRADAALPEAGPTDANSDALDEREGGGLSGGCACRTAGTRGAGDRGGLAWMLAGIAFAVIARRKRSPGPCYHCPPPFAQ